MWTVSEAAAIEYAAEGGGLPEEEFATGMYGVASGRSAHPHDVDSVQYVSSSIPLVVSPAVGGGHVVYEDLVVRGAGGCRCLEVEHDGQFAAEGKRCGLVERCVSNAHQERVVGEEGAGHFSNQSLCVVQRGGDFS